MGMAVPSPYGSLLFSGPRMPAASRHGGNVMQSGPTLAHEPGGQLAGAAVWRGTFPVGRGWYSPAGCWHSASPRRTPRRWPRRGWSRRGASVDRVCPGDSFQIAVVLRLPAGIHVNAHTPSDASLIPTRVQLAAPPGLRSAPSTTRRERASVPLHRPPIAVYEGETAFTATATVTATPDLKPAS